MENRKKEHPHKYTTTKTHIRNATENGPTRPDYYVATALKKQQQSYVTQSIRCRWNVAVVAVVSNFSEILYRNVITTYADSKQHHSKRHLTALSSVHSATLLIKKRQQPNETNPPHTHHQQPTNQPTDWLHLIAPHRARSIIVVNIRYVVVIQCSECEARINTDNLFLLFFLGRTFF